MSRRTQVAAVLAALLVCLSGVGTFAGAALATAQDDSAQVTDLRFVNHDVTDDEPRILVDATGELDGFRVNVTDDDGNVVRSYTKPDFYPETNDDGSVTYDSEPILMDSGNYTATVVSVNGQSASGPSDTVSISTPPEAKITGVPSEVAVGETINASARESTYTGTTERIESYTWTFGDGTTKTGVEVSHTYDAAGTYNVTLTVTDNEGQTDTATQEVTVTDEGDAQVIDLRFEKLDATDDEPLILVDATGELDGFRVNVTDDDGNVVDSYTKPNFVPETNDDGSVTYDSDPILMDSGNYTATVVSVNGEDASGPTDSIVITTPPVIESLTVPETVVAGEQFSVSGDFEATETVPHPDRINVTWAFGDGTTKTGWSANHTYAGAGTYTVTVTATDADDETATATREVTAVEETNDAPTASINAPAKVQAGNAFTVSAHGSADGDGEIAGYYWNFGDGTARGGFQLSHAYDEPGTYTLTLTVHDDDGTEDTVTETVEVVDSAVDEAPEAALSAPDTVQVGEKVTFDASGSVDDNDRIVGYKWDVDGDGEKDQSGPPATLSRTFDEPGTYTVTVVVCDATGHEGTATATVTVTAADDGDEATTPNGGDESETPSGGNSNENTNAGGSGGLGYTGQNQADESADDDQSSDATRQSDENNWHTGNEGEDTGETDETDETDDSSTEQRQTPNQKQEEQTTTQRETTEATTTSAETGEDGSTADEEATTTGGQPGFGLALALVAVIAAALLALRRE